ncbi:MAG: hypothetical protein IJ272_08085 [Clostridia bacterium]|nr:hypothetical protein [Clostridia bacterium]
MINDPKYINEVLDKLKKVSDEEIVEAIKKVDLEDDIKILEEELEVAKANNRYQYDLGWKACEIESIPISVIQNKKNEYEKMLKATYTDPTYSGDNRRRECLEALQVLQELLEERNK